MGARPRQTTSPRRLIGGLVVVAAAGVMALFLVSTFVGQSKQAPKEAVAFAVGESVILKAGYHLYQSIGVYEAFAACEASRDYDNETVAGRYARDAESAGDVMRAQQAAAYAARQARLSCKAEGRELKADTPVTILMTGPITVIYEGLIPKVASSKPQAVKITREDTLFQVEVEGDKWWVTRHGLAKAGAK